MAYGDIQSLSPHQRQVIKQIIRGGRAHPKVRRYSPRERRKAINTALAVGYTESRYRNLDHGDRDSLGWRQERQMYYKNPRNLKASVRRFYDEYDTTAPKDAHLGKRAQAVQRSGTPNVWDDLAPLANRVRKEFGADAKGVKGFERGRVRTREIPGVDNSDLRTQLQLDYLRNREKPGALLELASGLSGAQDTAGRTVRVPGSRVRTGGATAPSARGGPKLANTANRTPQDVIRLGVKSDRLNQAGKLPYQWGGGHGAKPASIGTPVDCSGFVSQLLGVAPRTSGGFLSWGKPGVGKHVTIWTNPQHILLSVRDPRSGKLRWFGTSKQNKGGGAGEIKTPSKDYLSGFTPRRPGGRR